MKSSLLRSIEVMSPAGSFEALMAAIQAGANSVYFGVGKLNMRAKAASFQVRDLSKIIQICRKHNVGSYLTLNSVMYDSDISQVKKICQKAKLAGVSAIIAHDLAVLEYAKSIELPIHISTQANVSNLEAVRFFSKYAEAIVLARELTLAQISTICNGINTENITGPSGKHMQIEIFAHGALCMAISGKCYLSLGLYNASANRGECVQICRKSYTVTDDETGAQLNLDNKYVMSPKDLCIIPFLDKILNLADISILKIEGRGRTPEYVYTVTKVYREAVDAYLKREYTEEKKKEWMERLSAVYNRGFWEGGYYLGKKLGEWSNSAGSTATMIKTFKGTVLNYYAKKSVAFIKIEAKEGCHLGERLLIQGPTSGVIETTIEKMFAQETSVTVATKGMCVTLKVPAKVRKNDKVYVISNRGNLFPNKFL